MQLVQETSSQPKKATTTIPIVMVNGGDAVGSGLVASLARPGGNVTGMATLRPELSGKRLELLKETVSELSRVAFFASTGSGDHSQILKEVDLAAKPLGVKVQHIDLRSPKDFEAAFHAASKGRAEAVLIQLPGPILTPRHKDLAELAVKSRLPVMYERTESVEVGGLMSYGVNGTDRYRRAAIYVDKILKGAKPADLPVEQPTKFEFVINLKAAKQIGLTIPPSVLARADRVIQMIKIRDQASGSRQDSKKILNRKLFCLALCAMLLGSYLSSRGATADEEVPRIGLFTRAARLPIH